MVDPIKLAHTLRKYGQTGVFKGPAPASPPPAVKPGMSSLRPRGMPTGAAPAALPPQPSLITTPGNMTMAQGPMPATAPTAAPAAITTPKANVAVRGGVGPSPKTAEDASAYLKQRLKAVSPTEFKPEKPPSLQSPKPPPPPKSFVPKKPGGYGGRAGMTSGVT